MTTINNAANQVFSSLKDSTNPNTAKTTSALLDEMTGTNTVQQVSKLATQSSYLLDLSPDAQAFLGQSKGSGVPNALNGNFILNSKQQQQIFDVLTKFKDEPFTAETYAKIDAELDKLGLSADALAIKDKARGINTTSMLLAALNGTGGDLSQNLLAPNDEQVKTKKDNYVKNVLAKWSDISTTIDADDGIDS